MVQGERRCCEKMHSSLKKRTRNRERKNTERKIERTRNREDRNIIGMEISEKRGGNT